MDTRRITAFGKINLNVDVTETRQDGYHNVKMIMQTVTLCDYVTVSESQGKGIVLSCDNPDVPTGSANIAYRAAERMVSRYGIEAGINIHIEKNIPMAAGMAGGSTDAAAVIKGINDIFSLNMSLEEMDEVAVPLGADVPFCLRQGTYLAEGIGERLTTLRSIPGYSIVIVNPDVEVSTREIFTELDSLEDRKHPDTEKMLDYIDRADWEKLFANMSNIFEPVTMKKCRDIERIKEDLLQQGAVGSVMTGTGPTVFGVFTDRSKAEKAVGHFKANHTNCHSFLCALTEQE